MLDWSCSIKVCRLLFSLSTLPILSDLHVRSIKKCLPDTAITINIHLSRLMTKPAKWHVRPAKTQISLGIRPVWSESSLSAFFMRTAKTGRMPRLIWVFAGRTCHFVGFVMRQLMFTILLTIVHCHCGVDFPIIPVFPGLSDTRGLNWHL